MTNLNWNNFNTFPFRYSVSRGPPVTIEWTHDYEETLDFDYFESKREPFRRLQGQMKMPPSLRSEILKNHGYTTKDLRKAMKDATVVRRQRSRSLDMMHTDTNTETLEAVKSILFHPFKSTKQKNEEIHLARSYEQSKEDLKAKYGAHIRTKAGERVSFEVDTSKPATHYSVGQLDESEETLLSTSDMNVDEASSDVEKNHFLAHYLARSYEQSKKDLKSKYGAHIRNKAGQRAHTKVDTVKPTTHHSIGPVDESEETHVLTSDVEENHAIFHDENNDVFDEASLEVRICQ